MLTRCRKSSLRIGLSHEAGATLERWQRSTIVVAADVGCSVRVQRTVVRQGGKHCLAQRLDGLADAPGHGARGGVSPGGRDPGGTPRL
jgi:hypothetical protein